MVAVASHSDSVPNKTWRPWKAWRDPAMPTSGSLRVSQSAVDGASTPCSVWSLTCSPDHRTFLGAPVDHRRHCLHCRRLASSTDSWVSFRRTSRWDCWSRGRFRAVVVSGADSAWRLLGNGTLRHEYRVQGGGELGARLHWTPENTKRWESRERGRGGRRPRALESTVQRGCPHLVDSETWNNISTDAASLAIGRPASCWMFRFGGDDKSERCPGLSISFSAWGACR